MHEYIISFYMLHMVKIYAVTNNSRHNLGNDDDKDLFLFLQTRFADPIGCVIYPGLSLYTLQPTAGSDTQNYRF